MKKPRLPTDEEIALFQESNKGTRVKKPVAKVAKPVPEKAPMRARDAAPAQTASLRPSIAPLAPLTMRELTKRAKPHGPIEATLDLHGLTQAQAHPKVQQFIARAQRNGWRHVAIITGKGRGGEIGVLRKLLPEWLNEAALRPMVAGFGHAAQEKGGTGVLHVLVKKP